MPFINQNASARFLLSAGDKLVVGSFGAGVSVISYDITPINMPARTVEAMRISNEASSIGPFAVDRYVSIQAGGSQVEYSTGRAPALSSGPSKAAFLEAGTRMPNRIGIICDSRMASAHTRYTASVASITGTTLSLTASGIGSESVGAVLTLGRSVGLDMIEATIDSVVGANQVTAAISYPQGPLPSGSIVSGNSVVIMQTRPPVLTSYATWLLGLANHGVADVLCFGYHGARIQSAITHQVRRAKQRDCDELWIHIGVNDYLTSSTTDGKSLAYIIEKIEELWSVAKGTRIVHFLETPLAGAYYSADNAAKVAAINNWIVSNASRNGIEVVDLHTPLYDVATGRAKANMLNDGLHVAMWGARTAALSPQVATLSARLVGKYRANLVDAGTVSMPLANPTMAGTLGVGNIPTGYTSSVTGLTTRASHILRQKDSETQEYVVRLTSTGLGSHFLKGAATTVTAGAKYRVRGKISVASAVNLNYLEFTLRNTSGDALIANVLTPVNYTSTGGDSDGTYTITADCEVVIPAGVTSVYVRPRAFFGSLAGSATIGYSDIEIRSIN